MIISIVRARMKKLLLLLSAVLLGAALEAGAAISVSFDSANSNVGAGIYAFDLSGAISPGTVNATTFNVQGWYNIDGNQLSGLSPVQSGSQLVAPAGWTQSNFDGYNNAVYYYEAAGQAVNGTFEINAPANLTGSLTWIFNDSGNNESISGTVNISQSAVPEPSTCGAVAGSLALLFTVLGRGRKGIEF